LGLRESAEPARLSSCQQSKTVSVNGCGEDMQQPHLTTYADIAEVRTVTGAAACNQLLNDGWVLLGVIRLTTVGEPKQRKSRKGQHRRKIPRIPHGMCGAWLVAGGNKLFPISSACRMGLMVCCSSARGKPGWLGRQLSSIPIFPFETACSVH
jgi:hypothetical protein